jgi:hypothetical protein
LEGSVAVGAVAGTVGTVVGAVVGVVLGEVALEGPVEPEGPVDSSVMVPVQPVKRLAQMTSARARILNFFIYFLLFMRYSGIIAEIGQITQEKIVT